MKPDAFVFCFIDKTDTRKKIIIDFYYIESKRKKKEHV